MRYDSKGFCWYYDDNGDELTLVDSSSGGVVCIPDLFFGITLW